ncbi:AI-2E family transporter [Myxococcota bacterium]
MSSPTHDTERLRRIVLVILAIGTSVLFVWMIWDFLLALLLAAILSGVFHPLYCRLERRFRGHRGLASAATIGIVLVGVIVPLSVFLVLVASQAVRLGQIARPWVEQNLGSVFESNRLFETVPQLRVLEPYRDQILPKLAELASGVGSFAIDLVAEGARQTVTFFLMTFVVLYAMYFFLKDGSRALSKVLYYLPLPAEDETRMVARFVSVSRATIKGTLVIGVLQGALGGVAFWVAGLDGAALWGTVMAVLSAIPGLGHAIVWLPAVVYLCASGQWGAGIGLLVWCGGVVGSVDNFLRPRLVGKDTQLPDLMILVSTLGGLILFGAVGFIVGPVVAALFVTVWDLYGTAFKDLLPPPPERAPSVSAPGAPGTFEA